MATALIQSNDHELVSADRWALIERLFHEALELDLQTRARFLDGACADDVALRMEVESLIAARQDGTSLKIQSSGDSRVSPALSSGQRLGSYEVLSLVGAGGMGEVYRARDSKIRRDVALKLLPTHFADDAARASRFRREAQALGALNHPHICTVYEVGEADGQIYIAMELVEGRPLSQILESGPLLYDEIVRFGLQLTDALVHAHERGIVHRDLKCANVIVTPEGRCKILDFGLATRVADKTTEVTGPTMLTEAGDVLGTPSYMAPEQARGGIVEARSDVWALGVMLYQMVSGALPFQGKTSLEVISAILSQPPAPFRVKVPIALRAIIERCLEKDAEKRFRDAREVRREFELIQQGVSRAAAAWSHRIRRRPLLASSVVMALLLSLAIGFNAFSVRDRIAGIVAPHVDSIAVLPLRNDSGDPDQDYLSDGMTEALIAELSQLGGFKNVIPRTTIMSYKLVNKPVAEIAKELDVQSLIEGSVVRNGDNVRVNIRLLKPSGQSLWGGSYNRDFREVLKLQGEIALSVAGRLKLTLTEEERSKLARSRTVDPEAYEAYLKGMISWYKHTEQDVEAAYDYFQEAIKKDPGYAPAYAGLAWVWTYRGSETVRPREVVAGFEKLYGQMKAAGIDEDASTAENFEGAADGAFYYGWNWEEAEKGYKKAVQLKPTSAELRLFYWHFLASMNRMEEARAMIQRAVELDPKNPLAQSSHGTYLMLAGSYRDAVTQFKKMIDNNLGVTEARLGLWTAYHHLGQLNEAYDHVRTAFSDFPPLKELMELGYKENGYKGAMYRLAEAFANASDQPPYFQRTNIAKFYAYAGEKEKTLEWLEKALAERESGLVSIRVDPDWKALRNEPRFQAIVQEMQFPK